MAACCVPKRSEVVRLSFQNATVRLLFAPCLETSNYRHASDVGGEPYDVLVANGM
jgi:hypothetical protein